MHRCPPIRCGRHVHVRYPSRKDGAAGRSLINYFAGQALQGFLAHSGTGYNERGELVALLPEEAALLAMKCAMALWRLTDEYKAEEVARTREDERVAQLHATYPHLKRRGRPGP